MKFGGINRFIHWHRWFAWYWVPVDDHWVWLETVQRKGTLHTCQLPIPGHPLRWWEWEYAP